MAHVRDDGRRRRALLGAAVAGIVLGAAAVPPASGVSVRAAAAEESEADVNCWGINACTGHVNCGVGDDDIAALKRLVGEKTFAEKFGNSKTHTCAGHATCAASKQVLNWAKASPAICREKGGYLIEENWFGRKVAKKAE